MDGTQSKENSDLEQKHANQNNSFPLCPICFNVLVGRSVVFKNF